MEMMKGQNELLEYIIKNKNTLEEESIQLNNKEKIIVKKLNDKNDKIYNYYKNIEDYKKMKNTEKKRAIINILQITSVGLLLLIFTNFLDNNVQTVSQSFKSVETMVSLFIAGFGNSIIVVDAIATLNNFKKENIDIYNIKKIEKDRNKYFNQLQKIRSDISITNESLNIFDKRIEELSNNHVNKNIYENILEKHVQKKKI